MTEAEINIRCAKGEALLNQLRTQYRELEAKVKYTQERYDAVSRDYVAKLDEFNTLCRLVESKQKELNAL